MHGIDPYTNGDTWPVHIYTSDTHSVHVVYTVLGHIQPLINSLYTFIHQTYTLHMSYTRYWAVLGHIQPLIHSLYTFIHQTYTLYMSYTRYWAIYQWWYMACKHLYIRHSPCTCRMHGIDPYTNGDTWPVHIYTSDIHSVHVVYTVLGHIQPLIHSLYTFIHQTYTLHMSYTRYWAIFNHWYIACTHLYIRHSPCTCRIHGIGPYSTIDT